MEKHPHSKNVQGSYKKADLHLHTNRTDGTLTPQKVVDKALAVGLDAIAITDHNTIVSSEIAFDYVQQKGLQLEVVKGIEVSSRDGHVLALGMSCDVERGRSLEDTIRDIHRQNGLVIIPHPDLKGASSVHLGLLHELLGSKDIDLYLDGIEVVNGSELMMRRFDKLGIIARRDDSRIRQFLNLHEENPKMGSLVGNTDAHTKNVGFGISLYSSESVLSALRNKATVPMQTTTTILEDLGQSLRMAYSVITSHLSGRI